MGNSNTASWSYLTTLLWSVIQITCLSSPLGRHCHSLSCSFFSDCSQNALTFRLLHGMNLKSLNSCPSAFSSHVSYHRTSSTTVTTFICHLLFLYLHCSLITCTAGALAAPTGGPACAVFSKLEKVSTILWDACIDISLSRIGKNENLLYLMYDLIVLLFYNGL